MILLAAVLFVALIIVGMCLIFKTEEVNMLLDAAHSAETNVRNLQDALLKSEQANTNLIQSLADEREISRKAKELADFYLNKFDDAVKRHNELVDATNMNQLQVVEVAPKKAKNSRKK